MTKILILKRQPPFRFVQIEDITCTEMSFKESFRTVRGVSYDAIILKDIREDELSHEATQALKNCLLTSNGKMISVGDVRVAA